jgi:hypothetical protein
VTRDDFFQQALLKMAEVILLRTDKEPTPEQLAKKASSYAEALHNEMLAGLARCDIFEMTEAAPRPDETSNVPVLAPSGPAPPAGSAPACPECQGAMKHRNGQYGPFWGCLAFPRCRGVVRLPK